MNKDMSPPWLKMKTVFVNAEHAALENWKELETMQCSGKNT